MRANTFTKAERLKLNKRIDLLFKAGKVVRCPHLLVYYLPFEGLTGCQVLFSVPKKLIKKASDRNTIKRRMREAYRLEKHKLATALSLHQQPGLLLGYVYLRKEVASYQAIAADVQETIALLTQR